MRNKKFWLNILEREIKTFCEAMIGYVGAAALVSEIDWRVAFSATGVAMILCLLANLKEIKLSEQGEE